MKAIKKQKRPQFDESENEESQRFIDHESDGYISFLLFLSQRESNRPLNLGKETKSLIYLISI